MLSSRLEVCRGTRGDAHLGGRRHRKFETASVERMTMDDWTASGSATSDSSWNQTVFTHGLKIFTTQHDWTLCWVLYFLYTRHTAAFLLGKLNPRSSPSSTCCYCSLPYLPNCINVIYCVCLFFVAPLPSFYYTVLFIEPQCCRELCLLRSVGAFTPNSIIRCTKSIRWVSGISHSCYDKN